MENFKVIKTLGELLPKANYSKLYHRIWIFWNGTESPKNRRQTNIRFKK